VSKVTGVRDEDLPLLEIMEPGLFLSLPDLARKVGWNEAAAEDTLKRLVRSGWVGVSPCDGGPLYRRRKDTSSETETATLATVTFTSAQAPGVLMTEISPPSAETTVWQDLNDWEEVVQVAEKHGWIAEENSKILALFLDTQLTELADVRRQLEEQKKATAAAEPDELPWPCPVRRTVGHFVLGHGGTGVNAPTAQAAEAGRCEDCGGPLGADDAGRQLGGRDQLRDRIAYANAERDSAQQGVERLRGEVKDAQDAARAFEAAGAVAQSRHAELSRVRDVLITEGEATRAWARASAEDVLWSREQMAKLRTERDAVLADVERLRGELAEVKAKTNCFLCGVERDSALKQRDAARDELAEAKASLEMLADLYATNDRALSDTRAELVRLRQDIAEVIEVAHRRGWNGVENSKILASFIEDKLSELARLLKPEWTEATREAVGSAAMSCCLSSAPHSLHDIGQAIETALAALIRGAPPEEER